MTEIAGEEGLAVLEETQDDQQIVERIAALDIGKAELVCCVRVPGPGGSRRRVQEVVSPDIVATLVDRGRTGYSRRTTRIDGHQNVAVYSTHSAPNRDPTVCE